MLPSISQYFVRSTSVSSRREGNQIFYSVRDPRILEVLDIMRRYFQSHLKKEMSLLRRIRSRASR